MMNQGTAILLITLVCRDRQAPWRPRDDQVEARQPYGNARKATTMYLQPDQASPPAIRILPGSLDHVVSSARQRRPFLPQMKVTDLAPYTRALPV